MRVEDMTFGIEFETVIPSGAQQVGTYRNGSIVEGHRGWRAKSDCSIRPDEPGFSGCEFVSPILKGAAGLRSVVRMLEHLRSIGAKVNASTGLHVHVGFDGSNRKALDRLISLVANFEGGIYAATGTKRRRESRYTQPISVAGSLANHHQAVRHDRFRILNVSNLENGHKPTVEFRAFEGTLDTSRVLGYIRLCLGLVERALTCQRLPDWTGKTPVPTSPMARKGDGQTQLTRLYYQLGWTRGRRDRAHGNLLDPTLPDLKDSKRALMRAARLYDRQ